MRKPFDFLSSLILLGWMVSNASAASSEGSPTRVFADKTDFLIEIHQPRQIHDLLMGLDLVKELPKIASFQEFQQTTNFRRFQQLLRYYEKELGAGYPDLISQLAGGGIAVGLTFGANSPELVMAIQGQDKKLTQAFATRVQRILEQEMQRQEINSHSEAFSYHGINGIHLNKDLHFAVVDALMLLSNKPEALEKAIDLAQQNSGQSMANKPALAEARKLLPSNMLGWFWVNMETARKAPDTDALYKKPRDLNLTIIAGPVLDVFGQVPYFTGGVIATSDGLLLTVRLPGGREMIGPELVLHMPQDPERSGCLPPLKARQLMYTDTSYFDFEKVWTDRAKIFAADVVKSMEKNDQSSGRIPFLNLQLSKILTSLTPYHRTIVANQNHSVYKKKKPQNPLPAFAFVLGLREESFGKNLESTLRAAALFGSQIGLTLAEESYQDIQLIAYRFDETKELPQDDANIRFNFTPCFAQVGKQFFLSSTVDLARELIEQLKEENKKEVPPSKQSARTTVYGPGIADFFAHYESQLMVQTILDLAMTPEEAKKQIQIVMGLLRNQGTASVEFAYYPKTVHIDFVIRGKQAVSDESKK